MSVARSKRSRPARTDIANLPSLKWILRKDRRLGLRFVGLVAAVLVGSGWLTSPARGGGQAAAPIAHRFETQSSSARAWTVRQMMAAPPMVLGESSLGDAASEAADPPAAEEAAYYERRQITDPSSSQYRIHGKLFVRASTGRGFYCSATSVVAANESVVITAAHCVHSEVLGGWAASVVFVPGYDSGAHPFGAWVAQDVFVPSEWISEHTYRADIAALVMQPRRGRGINEVVGGARFVAGFPRGEGVESFGYPTLAPFDGEHLQVCATQGAIADAPAGSGPPTMGIGCDLTGGSSGGGWIAAGNELRSVNSYRYLDPATGEFIELIFGPFFAESAVAVYERAASAAVTGLFFADEVGRREPNLNLRIKSSN